MPNEIIRSLKERKSVRVYAERPILTVEKNEILNAALQAPTAGNMTLYTIIDVTDQHLKEQLAILCDNQPFIAKAPLVLIFLADWQRWYDSFTKVYGDDIRPPQLGDLWLAAMDANIAAQNTVVAAESFGIGSCYIGDIIENAEQIKELLDLPDYVVPACMLVYGYPTEQQKNRTKPTRFSQEFICHENSYKRFSAEEFEHYFQSRDDKSFDKEVSLTYKRKWNQEFMLEMNRSMEIWLEAFLDKKNSI